MHNAAGHGKLDGVGQKRQNGALQQLPVDHGIDGRLRQLGFQRAVGLLEQLAGRQAEIVKEIGQISHLAVQRRPRAERGEMAGDPQQLIAGAAHNGQIPLQAGILRVRKQRENGGRDRQKAAQGRRNGLRRMVEDGGDALIVVGRGDKQQQSLFDRLRNGAEAGRTGVELQGSRVLRRL